MRSVLGGFTVHIHLQRFLETVDIDSWCIEILFSLSYVVETVLQISSFSSLKGQHSSTTEYYPLITLKLTLANYFPVDSIFLLKRGTSY